MAKGPEWIRKSESIIWAAVSTKPQLKGDSLDQRIGDGNAVCERFGRDIVATLKVPGQSRGFVFFQDALGSLLL